MYLQAFQKLMLLFLTMAILVLGTFNAKPGFASPSSSSSSSSAVSNKSPSTKTAASSSSSSTASPLPLKIFPMENYDQNMDHWIKSTDANYQKPLVDMSYQKKRLEEFYQHSFATDEKGLSPWSPHYVKEQIQQHFVEKNYIEEVLAKYNNQNQTDDLMGYTVNFRLIDKDWMEKIKSNVDSEQFKKPLAYRPENRAIFIQNTYARALPSQEPIYYHHGLAGEGYPFDRLQMSSIWAGTSAYILGLSQDKNWSLVLTPNFICWVKNDSIAKANNQFIKHWQRAAKHKLAAITQTETPIIDRHNKHFYSEAYVGSVFPLISQKAMQTQILFPSKDSKGFAQIRHAMVAKNAAVEMPLVATPENFVMLIKTLQNRPYGWGGLYFLNDCSSELKSLYTPFGFWLARHSSDQTKAGKMIDKSNASPKEKIAFLNEQGRPFMTIVYNTKHVFLYLGSFASTDNHSIPLTYQNVWALKPLSADHRAIIGKAVLLPLLENFAEDSVLNSQANHKDFQVVFLDEWPEDNHP